MNEVKDWSFATYCEDMTNSGTGLTDEEIYEAEKLQEIEDRETARETQDLNNEFFATYNVNI